MTEELTLESILQKDVADLSEEERNHLNEHKSQLNAEELEKFATVLTDEAPDNDGKSNPDEDGKEDSNT